MDENICWKLHAQHICNKIQSNKRLLANSRNLLSNYVLKKIYYALIYSHLTYGLVVWGSLISKSIQNHFITYQKPV